MEFIWFVFIVSIAICTLFLTPAFLKNKERMRLIDAVRTASERGEPIPPEVLSSLTATPPAQRPSHLRDMRRGVVLISAALAVEIIAFCVYAAAMVGNADDPHDAAEAAAVGIGVAGFGALPACIGLAFLLLSLTGKKAADA